MNASDNAVPLRSLNPITSKMLLLCTCLTVSTSLAQAFVARFRPAAEDDLPLPLLFLAPAEAVSPALTGVSATNCIIPPSSSAPSGIGLVMIGLGARPGGTADREAGVVAIYAGIADNGRCSGATASEVDALA